MIDKERICKFHYDEVNKRSATEPYEIGQEIVRCKECAKRKKNKFCLEHMRYEKNEDGYCSYGEREGE